MTSLVRSVSTPCGAPNASSSAEAIPGDARCVGVRTGRPSGRTNGRSESRGLVLPLLALRPNGDGIALARTLARVLVRRALTEEGAIGAVDHCTTARPKEHYPADGGTHRTAETI